MIVIVAEKPSVGRDIARVLKCGRNGEGCLIGEKYTVTWALGHLVTLCDPDEIDEKYKKWRMDDLPILPDTLPTKIIPKTRKQFTIVKRLINDKETERVICATDAGREGELIFHYIYAQAKCQKPVDRLWISSMTDEAIREGFDSLRPDSAYDGLRKSAVCRSEADWLVGMNASRAFTLRYGALLSIGRVQTPTLNILVSRRKEIENFKPVEYYTLTADFGAYSGQWFDENAAEEKTAHRIADRARADALAAQVRGKPSRVRSAQSEEKKELPPQLYDLTSLQRDANRMLGFTADKTLKIAQALYEKWKLLTYPRTDSRYLPMDMLPKLYQTLRALPSPYRELTQGMERREDGKLFVSKRIFDNSKVSDHHALLPTPRTADLSQLPPDERSLYDLVARRMLAAFYPAHVYDALRVVTECEDEVFRSLGRTVKEMGWKALYQQEEAAGKKARGKKKADDNDTPETALPPLQAGDTGTVQKAFVQQCATKPPAPHTDASLLSAMEHAGRAIEDEALRESMKDAGLGTPATRAAIIERLLQVGYAQRRGRAILATDKGVQLIEVAPEEIASPEMTGKWEQALDEIAHNQRDTARFMEGIRRMSAFLVQYARDSAPQKDFPEEMKRGKRGGSRAKMPVVAGAVCPLCGKPVQESEKAFGCSAWRDGCRFTLWKDGLTRGGGPALNVKIVSLLLQNREVRGSTGILRLEGETLTFTPSGAQEPSVRVGVRYERKK